MLVALYLLFIDNKNHMFVDFVVCGLYFIIFDAKHKIMEVLTRKYYTEIVDSWLGKGKIINLVGSRRVGKSYVLKDFIQRH